MLDAEVLSDMAAAFAAKTLSEVVWRRRSAAAPPRLPVVSPPGGLLLEYATVKAMPMQTVKAMPMQVRGCACQRA